MEPGGSSADTYLKITMPPSPSTWVVNSSVMMIGSHDTLPHTCLMVDRSSFMHSYQTTRLLWVRDCKENNVLTNVYISRKALLDWKTHVLSQILFILCSCWECSKYALSTCKLYIILWLTTIVYNIGFKVLFIYLFLLTEILFSLANSHQSIFWNCSFELYSFQFYIPMKPWAIFFLSIHLFHFI